MTLASILIVDIDPATRSLMANELRALGHDVSECEDAGGALAAAARKRPDLMVCDVALPDLGGVELLSDIRNNDELRSIRVLITSARRQSDDVLVALESGADDFINKPIDANEFSARVSACLRRPANVSQAREISAGGIRVDTVGQRVIVDGAFKSLAPREYRLLSFLLGNQDRVFSRKQLLVHVWDRDATVGVRTVDVHIRRLRSVLEPCGYDHYLQTVRGSGYRFSLEN